MFSYWMKQALVGARSNMRTGIILVLSCHIGILAAQDHKQALQVKVSPADGNYSIGAPGLDSPILRAGVAAQLDGQWLKSSSYPKHTIIKSTVPDDLGTANEWTVTFSGLAGEPDLIYHLRAYPDKPVGDIQVIVRNGTSKPIHVESIRIIAASGNSV